MDKARLGLFPWENFGAAPAPCRDAAAASRRVARNKGREPLRRTLTAPTHAQGRLTSL